MKQLSPVKRPSTDYNHAKLRDLSNSLKDHRCKTTSETRPAIRIFKIPSGSFPNKISIKVPRDIRNFCEPSPKNFRCRPISARGEEPLVAVVQRSGRSTRAKSNSDINSIRFDEYLQANTSDRTPPPRCSSLPRSRLRRSRPDSVTGPTSVRSLNI